MAALNTTQQANPGYLRDSFVSAAFPSKHSIEYIPLADGSDGTYQSLEAMAQAVRGEIGPDYSGWADPDIKRAAESVCVHRGQSRHEQVTALFSFVTQRITYVLHPMNQQVVQDAKRTLELKSGDCVSLSVLLATLLCSLGYQTQFVAQCVDGEEFSHVYAEVFVDGNWLALDAVAKDQPMGWRQELLDGGFELPWPVFKE